MHIQKWFALHDFFKEPQLEEITKLTTEVTLNKASVMGKKGSSLKNFLARNCKSGWIHRDLQSDWLFKEILTCVHEINKRTLKFDLQDCEIESLQYLEYGPFQFYRSHTDNGADGIATRKYSVSIQLSDENDYVGGNLTINGEGQARYAPRGRGSIAVFPSHLVHQARPVWIGKRKVLVAWIRGKKPLS
tara:strand:+ start:39 stop:605 length:567 start_codon:yes stop_codon:yes gene_type:complete